MCLGTTQLISSPQPAMNLSTQLGGETSVVYLTADTRGWYDGDGEQKKNFYWLFKRYLSSPLFFLNVHEKIICLNEALDTVQLEYAPFFRRPWVTADWHFVLDDEISMLDIVTRINDSLLQGVVIQDNDNALFLVIETLLEVK